MTQEELLKRYTSYNETVQEYMKMLSDALIEKYVDIPEHFVVSLDVLAGNLVIMNKALTSLTSGQVGLVGNDHYRGEKKSTELTAFMSAQTNVMKILGIFGLTPLGKSKIRENSDAGDVNKYLQTLLR